MPHGAFGPYPAVVLSWHDGDSGRFDLDRGWADHKVGDPELRLLAAGSAGHPVSVNAPELNTDAGKAALSHILTLCPVGSAVKVTSYHWDKYGGRYDATVTLPDGRDVGATMIADGHAVVMP